MIFISIIFRCLSFATYAMLLRFYVIIPVILMWFVAHNILYKVMLDSSFFRNICKDSNVLEYLPAEVMCVTAGPVILPRTKSWSLETTQEKKSDWDRRRRKLFLLDSIGAFILHGMTLITIIVLLETTDLLEQNLSICTFSIVRNNLSLICGCIFALGYLNCITILIYYLLFII